jgi:hypothetical protein
MSIFVIHIHRGVPSGGKPSQPSEILFVLFDIWHKFFLKIAEKIAYPPIFKNFGFFDR